MEIQYESEDQTIKDFGDQRLKYSGNEGYYGSLELFSDMLFPFLNPVEIKNCKVAEIGSGTGRIVNMLLESGVGCVIAVESSQAFSVLARNIRIPEKDTCLKITGEHLPAFGDLDYIFSIGVLHHIPYSKPIVEAAYRALRPGGRFFVWLYGKEGNKITVSFHIILLNTLPNISHFVV